MKHTTYTCHVIPGVTSRLDYLKELGVGTLWLSPFFKSPMRDFGYDVQNYTEIDPLFGTMEDFEELMAEAKNRSALLYQLIIIITAWILFL